MSGGGGGSSRTTTSTRVELPPWYEKYAKDLAGQAYNQTQLPYQQYPGERISPLTSQQTQGLNLTAGLGASNPLTGAANQQAISTLAGDYLDPGKNPAWAPGVRDITDAYNTGTAASRDALFSKAGAFGLGNSAYDEYRGQQEQGLADSLGSLWGGLYNSERGRQVQALGLSPSLNQSTYSDYQNLIGAGDAYRSYNQDLLNLNYQDWLDKQNYPWTQYQNFTSVAPALIGNAGGSTTTGPNPNKSSPIAGALGGGLAGGGLAAAIPAVAATGYGIPIAVLLGAIAGGALSS